MCQYYGLCHDVGHDMRVYVTVLVYDHVKQYILDIVNGYWHCCIRLALMCDPRSSSHHSITIMDTGTDYQYIRGFREYLSRQK